MLHCWAVLPHLELHINLDSACLAHRHPRSTSSLLAELGVGYAYRLKGI